MSEPKVEEIKLSQIIESMADNELQKIVALLLFRFSKDEMVVLTQKDWDAFMTEVRAGRGILIMHGNGEGDLSLRFTDREGAQAMHEFSQRAGHA